MRKEPEDFDETAMSLIYVARRLKEALRVEDVLTGAGLDYVVEPDEYSVGTIFRRRRIGAFFYVTVHDDPSTRELLRREGFTPYDERAE
jgi:hypothetical protein